MGTVGLKPEDFKKLPKDGARFESLIRQLLEAMGYRILEKPAVGVEGGRDVLVERAIKDVMSERREKVVVQCKHYAHSGKAIGDNDVGVWVNAMQRYKANGYLLVTDTRPTENLSKSFREYTNNEANSPNWAAFWDVDELISHLNKYPSVRDAFFPPEELPVTPLQNLADEVLTWLRAIRYKVSEPKQHADNMIDLLATLDEGAIKQRVLVRCVGGEIKKAHVDELDGILDRETPQGWLISDKRVSSSARKRASEKGGCKVFNLSEFLQQMIWGKYFGALTELVEKDRIPRLYVDLRCYKLEPGKEEHQAGHDPRGSLDAYMDEWLTERGKMHISLLGEFGAGKTWFCRHYAHRQLERFLKDPAKERLPLLITLRMFAKAMTAQQLINDALLEQYKLPFVGSAYEVFQEMNRRGKILLILDGFDEMARQVDYQTVVDNFWELAKLVEEGSKVILTSRTEYFRWAEESEKILGGEEFGRRTIVLEPPKFEVLYVEPFNDEEIRDVIVRRLGEENGKVVADKVLNTSNLAEMARKPILVELLLAALDEVSADVLENQAQVYLYATDKLLLRNITAKKTFTSTADKLYFLCELAWEMIRSGELRIHYTSIPDRIKTYFGDQIKDQHELDTWDFDLRAQTLLHRDAAGYYEFAHKSLAEYFVAFRFAAELGCMAKQFRQTYSEADGKPSKIPFEQKEIKDLAQTFGLMKLNDERLVAVNDLLLEMLIDDAVSRWWEVLEGTKGKSPGQVNYAGSNIVRLLRERGESFKGARLAQSVLTGADLSNMNLIDADLRGVCLREANLENCVLANADLRGADLSKAEGVGNIGVKSLLWLKHKDLLIVGATDGSARFWNTENWQEDHVIPEFQDDVCSIVATHDEARLIFGDRGDTAMLWDMNLNKEIRRFKNRHTGAHQMALSFDDRFLACGDDVGGIAIHDLDTGQRVKKLQNDDTLYYGICFNRNGEKVIGSTYNGEISIWDFDTAQQLTTMRSQLDTVYRVCHSNNQDRFIASGSGDVVECWASETGKLIFSSKGNNNTSLTYNHQQDKFAIASWHREIFIYDFSSGSIEQRLSISRRPSGKINIGMLEGISFSPDDQYLAVGSDNGLILIWDVNPKSESYGSCVKTLNLMMHCQGMQIGGASGLDQEMTWFNNGQRREGTLLEYFADAGAILDLDQERIVEEARMKNPTGESVVIETKTTTPQNKKRRKAATKSNGSKGRKSKREKDK
jgi:WD40 repeat protein